MIESSSIESIQQAALQLGPDDRAHLAHALVQSLGSLSEFEIAKLWLDESERRSQELRQGKVVGLPGDEVMRRISERHHR